MGDNNSAGSSEPHVLVVGGNSRSATVFRRFAAQADIGELTVLVRQKAEALPGETLVIVDDYFDPPEDVLRRANVVVNFAGISENRPEPELQAVNVRGPERLARKLRECGVKHFIQISSLHIYGAPVRVDRATPEAPQSAYARSKQAADKALGLLTRNDFQITLLRMPMHYGPQAGDKLRKLAGLIKRLGWFPVPRTPVRRSMVHQINLAAAIAAQIRRGQGGIQFVADPELFGYEILRDSLREHAGKNVRLIRLPDWIFLPLRVFAAGVYQRLYRDNVIAPELVIQPDGGYPVSMQSGLKDVVT